MVHHNMHLPVRLPGPAATCSVTEAAMHPAFVISHPSQCTAQPSCCKTQSFVCRPHAAGTLRPIHGRSQHQPRISWKRPAPGEAGTP